MASAAGLAGKLRRRFTPEEYLSLERAALEKNEYYDGEIFAMAGGTEDHNTIAASILASMLPVLRRTGCKTFGSDMKLAVTPIGPYFYPDVSVACGKSSLLDRHRDVLTNPVIIIEVLSKSTQRYDRLVKLPAYRTIPSARVILLVSQDRPAIEVWLRDNEKAEWRHTTITGLTNTLALTAPAPVSLPFAEIYADTAVASQRRSSARGAAPARRAAKRP